MWLVLINAILPTFFPCFFLSVPMHMYEHMVTEVYSFYPFYINKHFKFSHVFIVFWYLVHTRSSLVFHFSKYLEALFPAELFLWDKFAELIRALNMLPSCFPEGLFCFIVLSKWSNANRSTIACTGSHPWSCSRSISAVVLGFFSCFPSPFYLPPHSNRNV